METRKLRLLLLAYLRGLLKPDYSQGLLSRLREQMVLDALALEKDIAFALASTQLEASFSSQFSPAGARGVLQNCVKTLSRLKRLAEFDVLANQVPEMRGSVDALVKLYQALEKANIIQNPEET